MDSGWRSGCGAPLDVGSDESSKEEGNKIEPALAAYVMA
jgi:hypothetical protein